MVLETIILGCLRRGTLARGEDELAKDHAHGWDHEHEQGEDQSDVYNGANEGVPDIEELVEEEALAVKLGHQGAATVNNSHVGESVGRSGDSAEVAD